MTQATLLIIDDDVTLLARLAELFDEAGYRVLKTSDTSHGAVLLQEEEPDLVILEVNSDKGAGWSLLQRIVSTTPVLILSQQGREEDVVRGLDSGAVDYLAKPFRSQELLARVRIQLRHKSSSSEKALHQETSEPAETAPVAVSTSSTLVGDTPRARQAAGNETVVMPYDDEHMLTDVRAEATEPSVPEVSNELPLGPRLYAARQRRRVTLVQAENELNIRMYYLQAIEEEKFTLLPSASLTETFVNKYAAYLGQDAKQAVDEYRRLHYTQHNEPPKSLGGAAAPRALPRWIVQVVAIILAVSLCIALILWFDPLGASNLVEQVRRLVGV